MKETYKHECFGKSTIFRWHDDFKNGRLFEELVIKPNRPESIMNDRNVSIVLEVLQEN